MNQGGCELTSTTLTAISVFLFSITRREDLSLLQEGAYNLHFDVPSQDILSYSSVSVGLGQRPKTTVNSRYYSFPIPVTSRPIGDITSFRLPALNPLYLSSRAPLIWTSSSGWVVSGVTPPPPNPLGGVLNDPSGRLAAARVT